MGMLGSSFWNGISDGIATKLNFVMEVPQEMKAVACSKQIEICDGSSYQLE